MEALPVTDDLRQLWTEFAVQECGEDQEKAKRTIALVIEIGDEGIPVIDREELEAINVPPDWTNAFWLPLFAMTVFAIASIAIKEGWEKVRNLQQDEFQKQLAEWKNTDAHRDEVAEKALRFAQQREREIKDYLEELGKQ